MTLTLLSFGAFLIAFTVIGMLSARVKSSTTDDYLLAGRDVSPWLTALSSVATNNSGFMFIGLIGFTYRNGVSAVWLQLGWLLGDLGAWLWVHQRTRQVSGRVHALSVPALIGTRDDGSRARLLVVLAGLLTLLFLGGYAAAQLKAGSTALHVLFGWDPRVGAIMGALVVVVYCFSGGLRASIWTDAAQSVVMLVSLTVLLGAAVMQVGGPSALMAALAEADPALVTWIPTDFEWGIGLYVLGFVAGGFGAIGQPHIVIRSMAIESASEIPRARRIYFAWFLPFSVLTIAAGLYARVLLPELGEGAAEQALPAMSMALLPELLIGLMLAGLFAATMSTADSQLLACSAALTQDVAPRWKDSYVASKVATVGVTFFALLVALFAGQGVFDLVLMAWSALGATLGPLLLLRVFGRSVGAATGAAMMIAGLATVAVWTHLPWSGAVFELLPGMLVPFALYAIVESWPRGNHDDSALSSGAAVGDTDG